MKEVGMNIVAFLKKKRLAIILSVVLLALAALITVDAGIHGVFGDGWHHSEFRAGGEVIPQEAVGEAMEITDGE